MIQTPTQPGCDSYFSFDRIADAVMKRIARRRLIRARISVAVYGLVAILGGGSLMLAASYTSTLAAETGFADFVSLLLSGGADLAGSWNAVLLSVFESAPIMGTLALLASLLLCGAALVRFVTTITRLKSYHATI